MGYNTYSSTRVAQFGTSISETLESPIYANQAGQRSTGIQTGSAVKIQPISTLISQYTGDRIINI